MRKGTGQLQENHNSTLHGFLDWSSAGIYRSSLDGRILDCNEACARILGYSSRDELLRADALEEYYDPSVRQKFIGLLKAQGSLANFEIHYRRKNGRDVWALESARIVDGTPPVIEGILIDITDRKRAETRLQTQYRAARVLAESGTLSEAAPQLLKAICESLGWEWAALWDVDERGEALRCVNVWQSPAITSRLFEEASREAALKSGSGLPGRVWKSQQPVWIPDIAQDNNFPRIGLVTACGLHAALAFPIFSATTMLGVMEFFSRQIHEPDEDLLQMLAAVGSQIGQFMERKRTEMALEQSEERTRLIIKTALDAVVTMDEAGVITGWNPEAERTFGWSREEALGRRMSETIIPPQYQEAHEKGLRRFLETGTGRVLNQRVEITALHRDGHEFPIELAICAEQAQSRWHFSAFIRNINARKQAEEALQRSHEELERRVNERTAELREAKEAAEAANRAKSEFLANMSHEIRTPMNGVIGMTELALETSLDDEQRSYLNVVKSSAEALLSVINDILDFSKIEAGKLGLDRFDFDLRDTLWETLKALGVRADQKGLELSCDIHPGLPDVLAGDPGRLRQVMMNLVGNAIKFTERGEVVVQVVEESRDDGRLTLHFTVSDTGIGIPAGKQLTIFDAFTQADGSTTRKYGGTGLGLAISRQLVELMGGRIWVKCIPGKGSSFHFTANFGIGNKEAIQTPIRPDSFDLRGVPVLVVDDNKTNRTILEKILTHWGMRVTLAESGPAALAGLRHAQGLQDPFKLMLLDVCMPGMDGFDLVGQIREYPDLEQITIMMLSSAGMRGDALRCRELQIAAYLVKPVGQKELRDSVITVLTAKQNEDTPVSLVTRHTLRESQFALTGFDILLAEDNLVNQKLAVKLLEKHGHRVQVAGNGREALAALEKGRFQVVLMDVQMPVMGGFEATAAIREQERTTGAHIPIIAMTAHAMKGDRERCLNAGMDGYVSKPIKIKELLDAIGAAVSSAVPVKENDTVTEPSPTQPIPR